MTDPKPPEQGVPHPIDPDLEDAVKDVNDPGDSHRKGYSADPLAPPDVQEQLPPGKEQTKPYKVREEDSR